ncbi:MULTISPECIES: aminotransferase-like domain-containing protein [Paenibacillus]|uniref:aminotransferase-like domain-containing protein n=1 Tax=Paenibacillus TaxID=44249 RepID=UPI0022B9174F|nr:PLP-dependent aminotransferase family protein [Paenibacillus caseinilyticus]MCZ8522632.1 PLP-dependent aminotransferase family protein [Paenibacillus caseinilyticus]
MEIHPSWKPEKSSGLPLYKQIAGYLRERIGSGEWTVGSAIPPQRDLAAQFGVNRSTIVTALEELRAEGLLEGQTGSGTRVRSTPQPGPPDSAPLDWNAYVNRGIHQPNLPAVRAINRAEADPSIVRLGTGELAPELIPSAMLQRMLGSIAQRHLPGGYEEPLGSPELRAEISRHLAGYGITAAPASILIVSGALQALHLISMGILRQGSTVFLENPSYLHSIHAMPAVHTRMVGLPMDDEGLRLDELSRYGNAMEGAVVYTIPSFHNPTGIVMSGQRRGEVLRFCQERRLPLLEDDVYRDLWLDAPPPPPIKALDTQGVTLYIGSLSKTLSPGLRVGWIVGPQLVIERLADIKMQTDYGTSSLSQVLARECLGAGLYEEHLQRVRTQLTVRRDAMLEALERYCRGLLEWRVPQGGFYVWARILTRTGARPLFERMLSRGFLLNPGYVYGPSCESHLRLSYAYASLPDMQRGIRELGGLLRGGQ